MSENDLQQIRAIIQAEVLGKIGQHFDRIDQRLGRIEKNQETMIGTLNELSDAFREQQVQLRDHEVRIDKLERGDQNYLVGLRVH